MRKITKEAVMAFMDGTSYKNGNTKVVKIDNKWFLQLYGNSIAYKNEHGATFISSCGWGTDTTKERLNGLIELLGLPKCKLYRRGETLYYGDDIPLHGYVPLYVMKERCKSYA